MKRKKISFRKQDDDLVSVVKLRRKKIEIEMQNYSIDVSQIFIEEDKVERSHCSS